MKLLASLIVYMTVLTTAATAFAYTVSCGEGKDKDGDSAKSIFDSGIMVAASGGKDDSEKSGDDSDSGVSIEFPTRL